MSQISELLRSNRIAEYQTSNMVTALMDQVSADNLDVLAYLEALKNNKLSRLSSLTGDFFYRVWKDGQIPTDAEIIFVQKVWLLSIWLFRLTDDIIDDTLTDSREKEDFIEGISDYLWWEEADISQHLESTHVQVVILIAKELSRVILEDSENPDCFLEAYQNLANFVKAELTHQQVPEVQWGVFQNILDSLFLHVDDLGISPQQTISVKIALGVGAFTMAVMLPLTHLDLNSPEDVSFLRNMMYIGASKQLKDDINDREEDRKWTKISFATLSEKSSIKIYKQLERSLYKEGNTWLSWYQRRKMFIFKLAFALYTGPYRALWNSLEKGPFSGKN